MSMEYEAVHKRINRAAESILENEKLTDGLDDEAAQALIDWGLTCAKSIMENTLGLNDEEAEELTYPQLKATRRLMRSVSKWIVRQSEGNSEAAQKSLQKVIEQAQTIYGDTVQLPDTLEAGTLANPSVSETPQQIIANLRTVIEPDRKPNEIY
ncbi:MAG: hypothetical protein AAF629_22315 [Chloroflexota bacterium]